MVGLWTHPCSVGKSRGMSIGKIDFSYLKYWKKQGWKNWDFSIPFFNTYTAAPRKKSSVKNSFFSVHIVVHWLVKNGSIGGVVIGRNHDIEISLISAVWLHCKCSGYLVAALTIYIVLQVKDRLLKKILSKKNCSKILSKKIVQKYCLKNCPKILSKIILKKLSRNIV